MTSVGAATTRPGQPGAARPLAFYGGLALVTASTLMLQVIQTRLMSVIAWYYLAFFAISMAMFGLTAGAVWVYLRRDRLTEAHLSHDLAAYSAAFGLVTALGLIVQLTLAPGMSRSLITVAVWAELAAVMATPFFCSGVVVSLALTRSPFPIGRVYGVDLLGAAAGCLGVLLILERTDAPSAVLWVGALAAGGALLFARSGVGAPRPGGGALATLLAHRRTLLVGLVAAALANGLTDRGIQPLVVKGRIGGRGHPEYERWNTFSRVAAYASERARPILWGPSPKRPTGQVVDQRYLNIDGDAGTPMYRFRGDLEALQFVRYDVTNLAYFLPGRERVAVIGVGGGKDVVSALAFGKQAVTGVEINPIFIDLLTRVPGFADYGGLARHGRVRLVVDEARSWFARSRETFDVIQMSLIDTWAATGAGAFSLSENGLYTTEAWQIFLRRLAPGGVFAVSRWHAAGEVNETGRMISLAMDALFQLGAAEPGRHLFVASAGRVATLVLAREPLTADLTRSLAETAAAYDYTVLLSPDAEPASPVLRRIVAAKDRHDLLAYTTGLDLDLSPPTDERPFFFNQLPLGNPARMLHAVRGLRNRESGVMVGNLLAVTTLAIIAAVSLALVAATIVVPLRGAVRDVGARLVASGTAYFLLIGVGFMMVEISLLQRMSVFLGHPVYALSTVLFSLILATGVGSLLSDRLPLGSLPRVAAWSALTGAYLVAVARLAPDLFLALEGERLLVRAGLCVAVIAPAGLLMGFGFPTGMRLVSAVDPRPTPWFWGINGAAGVLAASVAVFTSIAGSIGTNLFVAATCYLLLVPAAWGIGLRRGGAQRGPASAPLS
jgi:SAM-dependent methyltransferase